MKEDKMNELDKLLIQIQDQLVPKLDSYEQAIYHYVNRKNIIYQRIGRDSKVGNLH